MMALYPTWSPAEIKSALATTASGGLKKQDAITEADPFDVGSGLLALGGAARAGLVLDRPIPITWPPIPPWVEIPKP